MSLPGFRSQDLCITSFLSNFLGLAILKKLNTETRVYRTEYGIVTFILYLFLCKPNLILKQDHLLPYQFHLLLYQ